MTTVIASGLGAQAVAKAQTTWGGTFMATGQRTLIWKTAKFNFDPHYVQGGTYLAGGQLAPLASANVPTWTGATVTLAGDMQNTAQAMLVAAALGTSSTLTQIGTTAAYGLAGAGPAAASAPDLNSTWFDLQFQVPSDDGTPHPFNFHSCAIQKAEWVFDRAGLVTYSYDIICQQIETATAALSTTEPTNQQPFTMATANTTAGAIAATASAFATGTYNSEQIFSGMKKITFTLDRKFASQADRMYGGFAFQASPVTVDYVDLTVAIDADYTAAAKTALYDLLLSGATTSVVAQAVGSAVGASHNTFSLQAPAVKFTDPSNTPSPDGPKLVNSTLTGKGLIDPAGDPWLNGTLITADTGY